MIAKENNLPIICEKIPAVKTEQRELKKIFVMKLVETKHKLCKHFPYNVLSKKNHLFEKESIPIPFLKRN